MLELSEPTGPSEPKRKRRGIPPEILSSPAGLILVFFAFLIEICDWIPLPFVDQIFELPLEILFLVFYIIIVKPSLKELIVPFLVERIPLISDILPTWLLKIFGLF